MRVACAGDASAARAKMIKPMQDDGAAHYTPSHMFFDVRSAVAQYRAPAGAKVVERLDL